MFINYDINIGITINPFRKPGGYTNDDVVGLVKDILLDRCGNCPLDGTLDALEDGAAWAGSEATPEILEELHALITEYNQSKEQA